MFPFTVVPAYNLPVYASQRPLPDATQDSVRGCSLGFAAAVIADGRLQRACKAQPKQNPACRFPAPGSQDDIREERHITPSDASFEQTEARTTGDRPTVPSSADGVGHGVVGLASTVARFHGGSSSAYGRSGAERSTGRSRAASPSGVVAVRVSSNAEARAATRACERETFCSCWCWGCG